MSGMMNQPHIATRSAQAPPTLTVPFCLRCSKRLAVEPGLVCGKQNNLNCPPCGRKRKGCPQIPQSHIAMFNSLYRAARAHESLQPGGNKDASLHALSAQQKAYTKSVEAQVRRSRNAGGGRAPATAVEVGMLVFRVLTRIGDTLDGIHDLMRYQAHLPPIVNDPDDADDDETTT